MTTRQSVINEFVHEAAAQTLLASKDYKNGNGNIQRSRVIGRHWAKALAFCEEFASDGLEAAEHTRDVLAQISNGITLKPIPGGLREEALTMIAPQKQGDKPNVAFYQQPPQQGQEVETQE